jgi:hypothetical protein
MMVLWGIVLTIKSDRDYLIGAQVIIKTDCLSISGMISGCNIPDIVMLHWITYIKSLNLEIHVVRNTMLLLTCYHERDMIKKIHDLMKRMSVWNSSQFHMLDC